MKRMQALVTGKKKQCTKSPTVTSAGPVSTATDGHAVNFVENTSTTKSGDQLQSAVAQGVADDRATAGNNIAATSAADDGGAKVLKQGAKGSQAGNARRPVASMEASPAMPRKGSGSKIPATSPRKNGSSKRSSSPPRLRTLQDLEDNKSKPVKQSSKVKPGLSKKPSTKEKKQNNNNDSVPTSTESKRKQEPLDQAPSRSKTGEKTSNHKTPDGPSSLAQQASESVEGSPNMTGNGDGRHPKTSGSANTRRGDKGEKPGAQISSDPRSRKPIASDAGAAPPISPPPGGVSSSGDGQLDDTKPSVSQPKVLPPPPLHGILKDSKRPKNNHNRNADVFEEESDLERNSIQNAKQEKKISNVPNGFAVAADTSDRPDKHSTRAQSRSNSMHGSKDGVYSQVYYNTLPRGSSSNMVSGSGGGEGHGYGYNSLPRRSDYDITGVEQNSGRWNDATTDYSSWGSLPRRETDSSLGSGYNAAMDRSFSSTGSSGGNNFSGYTAQRGQPSRPINGRASQRYPAPRNHYYHHQPPRPDSVPPIGTNGNNNNSNFKGSSGDVFYDVGSIPRPGSVPPGYHSETEAGREWYVRPSGAFNPLQHGHRSGSVPLGYDAGLSVAGYTHNPWSMTSMGRYPRPQYPSSGHPPGRGGLKVQHPGDERYRAAPGSRRAIPRRHTVGTPHSTIGKGTGSKSEQDRDAAMQYLAKCYPEYAKRIQGAGLSVTPPERTASSSSSASPSPQPDTDKPMRARDAQRRRTAMVTYDPTHAAQTLEYDDLGTMSDLELPSFQRGGFMRTSLPMPRCASTSLERPLGLVFLVSGDQTKKAMLPNEITALDTVRALFVRAFPDLTLEMLESPRRKIYILDPATNIYFQLEDLAEIKDRSVLKLHETDSNEPQRVKERQEVRGRTVQMPQSRPQSRPNPLYDTLPGGPDGPGPPHHYPQDHWDPTDRRSRSRTPEPAERPRSLSAGSQSRQRISHSPEHMGTPSNPLNPIPENRQFLAQHNPAYRREGHHHPHHQMPLPVAPPPPPPRYYDPSDTAVYGVVGPGSVAGSHYAPLPASQYETYAVPPALAAAQQQQTYVARSMRAPPLAHPQRAVAPGMDYRDGLRGSSVKQSPPYNSSPDSGSGIYQQRPLPQPPADDAARDRMEKMEQQLASLEAWVHKREAEKTVESKGGLGPRRDMPPPSSIQKHHQAKVMGSLPSTASGSSETFPGSTSSSISDVSGGHHRPALGHGSSASSVSRSDTSTPVPSMGSAVEARARLAELRADLQVLRRQQQLNMEVVRDEITGAWTKLQKVIGSVPGAENKVLVHKRSMITLSKTSYLNDKDQVDRELSDLEASVEEQRNDVISRRCRVNIADVEGMALLLSSITKSLADLKARFPELQSQMKDVMDAEMRIVVAEEKFLKGEPSEIEKSLKRCKNLTQTLFTLKRLASAQDLQPPHVPNVAHGNIVAEEDQLTDQKHAVLESINALIPDHQQRVEHIEAAEAARERKKKISTQKEALKFGKSLEAATKQLRPPPEQSQGHREVNQDTYNNMAECDRKPPSLPAKPPVASKPVTAPTPQPPSISSESSAATHVSPYANQTAPSSSPSTKSAFTAALTTSPSGRVAEKPTATVSAMTAHVSDSITATAAKTARPDRLSSASEAGLVSAEKQQQSTMGSTVSAGTGAVTQTVYRVQTPVSQRGDADISTYQVCGPVNPMIPSSQALTSRPNDQPPAVGSHVNLYGSPPGSVVTMGGKDSFENPRSAVNGTGHNPSESLSSSSSPLSLANSVEGSSSVAKKPSVTFAETISNIPSSPSLNSPPHTSHNNDHNHTSSLGDQIFSEPHNGLDKPDLATQKQAARNAFFSSLNSPPSPSSKDSATLDPGPVVSPGLVGKVTPGSTINLVLAGTASPKSPTHPGTFTIQPPADIRQRRVSDSCQVDISSSHPQTIIHSSASPKKTPPPTLIPPRQSSLDSQLPPHGPAPLASIETSSSSSEGDYAGAKPKKVPPPPPPRKGSRPTSVSGYPGFPSNMSPSHSNSTEAPPRFVGGVLGQHRLSGGPLSSTPKSGNYMDAGTASMQGQPMSTFQQLPTDCGSERNSNKATNVSVVNGNSNSSRVETADLDGRQERGSSSESTGSSGNSGHSIVSVVRAQSVHSTPGRHVTKPAPPKRQSSLLAKFTGK